MVELWSSMNTSLERLWMKLYVGLKKN